MFNQIDHAGIRRIAIVGSGMAGLSLALLLQKQGSDVVIYEKSRGPGGRLASRRVTDGSVDIGAQYFTIRNPRFRKFLSEHAGEAAFAIWNGTFRYQNAAGKWEPFTDDCRYVGVPRMTALSRALASSVNLETETLITRLEQDSNRRWWLESGAGNASGPYDSVIITAPPAQAAKLLTASGLTTMADSLQPAIAGMQPCWAVAAHFPETLQREFSGAGCNDRVLAWAGNNSSKPGRNGAGEWWVLHATAEWSRCNQDADGDEVAEELLQAFRRITGVGESPDQIISHRWLYSKPVTDWKPGYLWHPEEQVGLAGDWLSGGRVEGAFDSASGLADQLQS